MHHLIFPLRFLLLVVLSVPSLALGASPIQERADRFLKLANAGYQALFRVNSETQWLAVTNVTPEHDAAAEATGKAYAAFNGNPAIISEARDLLVHQNELNELTVRQLKQLLLNAAEGPMTNPDLVAKRVAAETKQASIMNSFEFKLDGHKITANEIDDKLEKSADLGERKAVWEDQNGLSRRPSAHHELGHGYYFKAYTRPEVPYLLRIGAAPGFHEGVGELIALASSQVPYLQSRGVLPADFKPDKTAFLLDDALARSVPFIYFSCGVMPHWEADIYAHNLPPDQWNARWWKYVSDFQGIEPPSPRGEEFCDAATKTHINDNPAYYYNYAFATVFKFQLHDYIARKILHQPPQSCNYADNKEVGTWLNNILQKGGTEDWRRVLKEATGEDISTRAMADYFKPLMSWVEEQNKGRQIGWE